MPDARPRKLLAIEASNKFKLIEAMIVAVAASAILLTALISYLRTGSLLELVGQVLIIVVLLVSIRYGRSGALLSAAAATFAYEVARFPDLGDAISYRAALELVGVRGLGYLAAGLIGSEAMRWTKYYLAEVEGSDGLDSNSGLYAADFIKALIKREIDLYERYSSIFSLVVVEIDAKELRGDGAFGKKKALAELGSLIKNNVRLVDEVGRLNREKFAILLPHTGLAGATAVAKRIEDLVFRRFGVGRGAGFSARPYSVPEDLVELRAIAGRRVPSVGDAPND